MIPQVGTEPYGPLQLLRIGTPGSHLAGVGAELAIAAADAPGEPPAATGNWTAGAGDQTGDLGGEALPDGLDQSRGAVVEREWPAVLRGD